MKKNAGILTLATLAALAFASQAAAQGFAPERGSAPGAGRERRFDAPPTIPRSAEQGQAKPTTTSTREPLVERQGNGTETKTPPTAALAPISSEFAIALPNGATFRSVADDPALALRARGALGGISLAEPDPTKSVLIAIHRGTGENQAAGKGDSRELPAIVADMAGYAETRMKNHAWHRRPVIDSANGTADMSFSHLLLGKTRLERIVLRKTPEGTVSLRAIVAVESISPDAIDAIDRKTAFLLSPLVRRR